MAALTVIVAFGKRFNTVFFFLSFITLTFLTVQAHFKMLVQDGSAGSKRRRMILKWIAIAKSV